MNDALAMIRTAWGWMINNPASTGSTVLEAWGASGEITYPFYKDKPSYISHCHPFSTGPVLVLTYELLALNFTDVGGKSWEFRPCVGDLEHCQGGFTGTHGKTRLVGGRQGKMEELFFSCWVEAPEGTIGRVRLPVVTSGWPKSTHKKGGVKCDNKDGYEWLNGISGGERRNFVT